MLRLRSALPVALGRRRWLVAVLGLLLLLASRSPRPAAAHPLGNFSVNRYSALTVRAGDDGRIAVDLLYVIDMAEIPTFQERPLLDTDQDGAISPAEEEAYLARQQASLAPNLHLSAEGRAIALRPSTAMLAFPPGQGDLPTTRITLTFQAALPAGAGAVYTDGNYADRLGWQEIVVRPGPGVRLAHSSVPAEDLTDALRLYPEALLQSPLRVSQATFSAVAAVGGGDTVGSQAAAPVVADAAADRLTGLLTVPELGPAALALALLVAAGLGAAHALAPGHGKTIVGAYLVGSRGTARHALFLGLTTTITHTAGVFVFGLIVLFASRYVLPERLYPWLGALSGGLIVFIGLSLLRSQLRQWRAGAAGALATTGEGYHYHLGYGHTHQPATGDAGLSWSNLLALGVSGGLLPCPSALLLLLSAVALGRVGLGLVLIGAFSLGLASVLTGIGLVLVHAGRLFDRVTVRHSRLARLVPIFSASFVTLAGLAMTIQAVWQTAVS